MQTIAVWFSCGAASAVAAKKTAEIYGQSHIVRVVNNPVIEEDADNRRFLIDVEKWVGVPIEIASNKNYPAMSAVDVWDRRKFMSGRHGAPCTVHLKKEAREQWEKINNPDWHVLGFTYDEVDRHERFIRSERENVIPVLIEHRITKAMCFDILRAAEIKLPAIYDMGYPNANCIGCVKASNATYWNHVRAKHPEIFQQRAEQSRRIGAKLARHKGKRVFLDKLSPDARGRPMKTMQFECGIFCEPEKTT